MDRVPTLTAQAIWPLFERYATPQDLVARLAEFEEILGWIDRGDRASRVVRLAGTLGTSDPTEDEFQALVADGLIHQSVADLALLVRADGEEPVVVSSGALRVATRFQRSSLGRKNQNSDGRIAISKMIGFGPDAREAQLALLELGTDVCLPARPRCADCPLSAWCRSRDEFARGPEIARVLGDGP